MRVSPLRALSHNISSFLPVKPRKHSAENPFLHSSVMEQCVLTGCTAVFPAHAQMPAPAVQYLQTEISACSYMFVLKSTACAVPQSGSQHNTVKEHLRFCFPNLPDKMILLCFCSYHLEVSHLSILETIYWSVSSLKGQ